MSGLGSSAATVVIMLGLAAGSLYAQTDTSAITGQITDRDGVVVAGATIILTNPSTNSMRISVSSASGIYIFPKTLPCSYSIELSADAFRDGLKGRIREKA